ncbi:aldehyde dehydrogenase family protein [Flexivirga endophytica]|nr:aldehyde dehydrogenase family protein [Flexivirga endophytica]
MDTTYAPRTGRAAPGPEHSTDAQLAAILDSAAAAARRTADATPEERRQWLDAVANALEKETDRLVGIADEETALGVPRLTGELAKAAENARFYGRAGQRGEWLRARIERLPNGPELRRAQLPIGPVAVFGASNFPFQFGTIGHDTCSALAAGCPVVVKAHPAHPRLAATVANLVMRALDEAGAPKGIFGNVVGFDAGPVLVRSPQIAAVAFTGSQTGGMALVEAARRRPVPIPVYAEMGTVNPAVVTPAAEAAAELVAAGFVDSFTLGVGQFCTKPGLLLVPAGSTIPHAVAELVRVRDGGWMLTEDIASRYRVGLAQLRAAGAEVLAQGWLPTAGYAAQPAVLSVPAEALRDNDSRLREECFGPAALVVTYQDVDDAVSLLEVLQPSLAGSVFSGGPDDPDVLRLVQTLAAQVGRVTVDEWPTGVACNSVIQHGGPWPATSIPTASSVGAAALERFTRPVCFQNIPEEALPPALQDANPWFLPEREVSW